MPGSSASDTPDAAKVVEKQMRNWELARAQRLKALEVDETQATHEVAPFVAISRQVGSGGREVAEPLSARLHWPLFDKEILQAMAGDDRMRARLYETTDERDTSWIEETLRWLIQGEFRKQDYFHRLFETVLVLARQGSAVFLGRGTDLILPRERGLCVRIVASLDYRVRRFAARNRISLALARAEVERVEQERTEFVERHFGRRGTDVARQDLTLNLERFTAAQAADLIHAALRLRGLPT